MVWSAVNVQSPHAEIKMGLEWGSLVNFGSRGTRNAVPPPESEARISGPKKQPRIWTVCLAPHCGVQGTRSQIWAGNWAQNPVPKIRPSSGPAGWDKVCAPGVIRLLCQAKARVTVGMVLHTQAGSFCVLSSARPRWCGLCENGHPSPVLREQLRR